jgi:imidazoleglycerol-phosphate dehydratase
MTIRTAMIHRQTAETDIQVELSLDGSGATQLETPVAFLNHMLDQIGRHGLFDLTVQACGDIDIDYHHTVEDVGITLGQAFDQALGDKTGITRYGFFYVPLDEALARVVIDFSGRPGLVYQIDFPSEKIGGFDTELFYEFFQGFANHAKATMHIDVLRGRNSHHMIEAVFKAFGRALRMAVSVDARMMGVVPSTKGSL